MIVHINKDEMLHLIEEKKFHKKSKTTPKGSWIYPQEATRRVQVRNLHEIVEPKIK